MSLDYKSKIEELQLAIAQRAEGISAVHWRPAGCTEETSDDVAEWIRTNKKYTVARLPRLPIDMSVDSKVHLIRKFCNSERYFANYPYNYLGVPLYTVSKRSSLCQLMKLAASIISSALPIKCLEAVVVALHLTCKLDLERVRISLLTLAISFKSECFGNIYRHIVLAVRSGDRWGCIGLSRKFDLMNKPLVYTVQSCNSEPHVSRK